MTVPEPALTKFRSYAASLRQLSGASADCQHRLNAFLRAKHEAAAERERIAASRWSPFPATQEAVRAKLVALDAELAKGAAEVSQLRAERAEIEARRGRASDMCGRLQAFLLERGASRAQVSY